MAISELSISWHEVSNERGSHRNRRLLLKSILLRRLGIVCRQFSMDTIADSGCYNWKASHFDPAQVHTGTPGLAIQIPGLGKCSVCINVTRLAAFKLGNIQKSCKEILHIILLYLIWSQRCNDQTLASIIQKVNKLEFFSMKFTFQKYKIIM